MLHFIHVCLLSFIGVRYENKLTISANLHRLRRLSFHYDYNRAFFWLSKVYNADKGNRCSSSLNAMTLITLFLPIKIFFHTEIYLGSSCQQARVCHDMSQTTSCALTTLQLDLIIVICVNHPPSLFRLLLCQRDCCKLHQLTWLQLSLLLMAALDSIHPTLSLTCYLGAELWKAFQSCSRVSAGSGVTFSTLCTVNPWSCCGLVFHSCWCSYSMLDNAMIEKWMDCTRKCLIYIQISATDWNNIES